MSTSAHPAVFISYAREDAAAAERLAEGLRSHGLEVWFDQDELRSGEAWDQKIRGQIRTCTLFLPIVSATTQGRGEGYFRREWKLAAERTHDMAAGIPFLVPVVIDDTPESAALVPEEFLRVQWTRLPHGRCTPAFATQVNRLLQAPRAAVKEKVAVARAETPTKHPPAAPGPAKSGLPRWAIAALGLVIIGVAAFFGFRPTAPETPPAATTRTAAATPPAVTDKSIAVLPLTNKSEDKEANAFFADGIHEEILTRLALVSELRVVSRTSVEQYRQTTKSIPQIGRELGVAWILEGSVFRAGNKVRVTGQLIRAAADQHAWAKSYDRDLTDIFAIQSELAQSIAGALQAAISPQEKTLVEHRPTENLAAYDLYLKALHTAGYEAEEDLLLKAVALDPGFVKAWCRLSLIRSQHYFFFRDHSAAQLAKAREALDRALQLAPDSVDTLLQAGIFDFHCLRDNLRALEQFDRVARLQPNNGEIFLWRSRTLRNLGRYAEALQAGRRATQLDPANSGYATGWSSMLMAVRRYDEGLAEQRRLVGLVPDSAWPRSRLAVAHFLATGSTVEMDQLLARLPAAEADSPQWGSRRISWACRRGDYAEAIRLDRLQPQAYDEDSSRWQPGLRADGDGPSRWQQGLNVAVSLAAQGDRRAARARIEKFPAQMRAELERDPANSDVWSSLAQVEMLLDHPEEARRCARQAMTLLPESVDAYYGTHPRAVLAIVQAWTGERDDALKEIARLLRIPCSDWFTFNVHVMRRHPLFFPLQGDPRFEALLNDPKNRAPLF